MRWIKKLCAIVSLVLVVGVAGFAMGFNSQEIAPVGFVIGLIVLMTGWGPFA